MSRFGQGHPTPPLQAWDQSGADALPFGALKGLSATVLSWHFFLSTHSRHHAVCLQERLPIAAG